MNNIKYRVLVMKDVITPFYIYNIQDSYDYGTRGVKNDQQNCFGEYLNDVGYIVEPYIGLNDRNDVEIYVGDVVDYCIKEKDQVRIAYRGYGTIIFAEQVAKYMIKDNEDNNCFDFKQVYNKNIEVLGNIHEKGTKYEIQNM